MSAYIQNPIDVLLFDKHFRKRGSMRLSPDAVLVQFKQGKIRWLATYQDEDQSMTFEGTVPRTREWLEEGDK